MKKPHARLLTVHKADINNNTAIEILWETAPNTLNLLLFCIKHDGPRPLLVTEEIGPYRSLAELRQQLAVLFGEQSAGRLCQLCPWLPPGIPLKHAVTFGAQHGDRSADSPMPVTGTHNERAPAIGRAHQAPVAIVGT